MASHELAQEVAKDLANYPTVQAYEFRASGGTVVADGGGLVRGWVFDKIDQTQIWMSNEEDGERWLPRRPGALSTTTTIVNALEEVLAEDYDEEPDFSFPVTGPEDTRLKDALEQQLRITKKKRSRVHVVDKRSAKLEGKIEGLELALDLLEDVS